MEQSELKEWVTRGNLWAFAFSVNLSCLWVFKFSKAKSRISEYLILGQNHSALSQSPAITSNLDHDARALYKVIISTFFYKNLFKQTSEQLLGWSIHRDWARLESSASLWSFRIWGPSSHCSLMYSCLLVRHSCYSLQVMQLLATDIWLMDSSQLYFMPAILKWIFSWIFCLFVWWVFGVVFVWGPVLVWLQHIE